MRIVRLVMPLLLFVVGIAFAGQPEVAKEAEWTPYDRSYQMVFFAVLEGLYVDGVQNDVVDTIIPVDAAGHQKLNEHFVYACPLCAPVMEAFRVYRARPYFSGQKPLRFEQTSEGGIKPIYADTFGKGLSDEVVKSLKHPEKKVRLAALQALIQKWVQRRMDSMRLTEDERKEYAQEFEKKDKEGAKYLKEWIGGGERAKAMGFNYLDWADSACPSCAGAVKGVEMVKPVKKD